MNPEAIRMSAQLAEELARSEPRRKRVDPRSVPLRFHHLKAMGSCAARCYESFQSDGPPSLAKRIGSGVHAILLGKPLALWDQPSKTGKSRAPRNGGDWSAFAEEHAGKVILNRKEHDKATRIAAAINSHSEARRLLFGPGTLHEQTIIWTQGGVTRQSTPDARRPGVVTELKTTRCASPSRFRYDVRAMCYHAQLADQAAAIRAETGREPEELAIVAVEKEAPYVVQTYRLTPRDLELGRRIVGLWFEQFRVAAASDSWGGYCDETIDLDLPDDDDLELAFGGDSDESEDSESKEHGR